MYSFNVVLGLLDELLELKENVKHESEAGDSSNFETFTAMTLKLQEVANFGMCFHVMQTSPFIHVSVQ